MQPATGNLMSWCGLNRVDDSEVEWTHFLAHDTEGQTCALDKQRARISMAFTQ